MSKMLRVRDVARADDFARAIAQLGKSLHKHDQITSRNTEENFTVMQR